MAETVRNWGVRRWNGLRLTLWGAAGALLLVPAAAMQFTREVHWTGFDFLLAALLIGGVGVAAEAAVRVNRQPAHSAGCACALGAALLIVWANGAVGMIGDEDNRYNLLFLAVIALAVAGAAAARFRPRGMAAAMAVAGVTQVAVALGGYPADSRGAVFSLVLAGPWLLAAALFRTAGGEEARPR